MNKCPFYCELVTIGSLGLLQNSNVFNVLFSKIRIILFTLLLRTLHVYHRPTFK